MNLPPINPKVSTEFYQASAPVLCRFKGWDTPKLGFYVHSSGEWWIVGQVGAWKCLEWWPLPEPGTGNRVEVKQESAITPVRN